jgi:aminocarboxymuconate-semialdehyde decarboxylase
MYTCGASFNTKSRAVRRNGKTKRIDIHCHYHNKAVDPLIKDFNLAEIEPNIKFGNALTRETNRNQNRDRADKLSSIEVRLKDMDKMGIDIQAVSPAPHQTLYWTEPELGLKTARMVNDGIADIVGKWPDRFVGLGTIPLQNADMAIPELERCVKQLGFRGIEVNTNVAGKNLTDETLALDKVFAKVQELDVIIFLHPLGFSHGERFMNHYFNNVIGNPLDTTTALAHLIFDGVLERYPKLKIVAPHAGGFLPFYHGRIDHAHRERPDSRTVIKKKPTSYLKKVYFDTITHDQGMLRTLIDTYGADHVLLGTDYPFDMGVDDPVYFIESTPKLTRAQKDQILGNNAAKLLKIK